MAYKSEYNPKPILDLFNEFSSSGGLDEKLKIARLPEIWNDVVTESVAKSAVITNYFNGKLFIKTASSTWRAELLLRKRQIIDKINEIYGENFITELVIK